MQIEEYAYVRPEIVAVDDHKYCGKCGDESTESGHCARRRRGMYWSKVVSTALAFRLSHMKLKAGITTVGTGGALSLVHLGAWLEVV